MKNLHDLILQANNLYPEKTFLDCPGEDGRLKISYQAFNLEVDRLAAYLLSCGVKKGDRVAFISPKNYYQALLFYAIWRIDALAVPVSESMGDSEVSFIINDADPTLLVLPTKMMDRRSSIGANRKTVSFDELRQGADNQLSECTLSLDDTAVLIYTSGSTGRPKGVMLSHRNLLVNARSAGDRLVIDDGERMLSLLPYWHSFALIAELVMMPMTGGTVVFVKDQRDFARNMASLNCSIMLVVPRMLNQFKLLLESQCEKMGQSAILADCLNNAAELFIADDVLSQDMAIRTKRMQFRAGFLSHLKKIFGPGFKFFIGGGAPLAPELQVFFRNIGLPVLQGYGLTETSPVVSVNTLESNRIGSSGKLLSWLNPVNGGDFQFLDSHGQRGKNLEGELLVKGDCVMQGYWRHKDESAKSIQEGWLHTGDIGKVEDGFIYITGRVSNLLVLKGGEKVHPEHVENLIKKCSLVKEVMLIGDKCKNVYAVINVEENDVEDIEAEVKKQVASATLDLAPFQKPKNILILPNFNIEDGTLTPTLKIRRNNVWQVYFDQLSSFLENNNEAVYAPVERRQ